MDRHLGRAPTVRLETLHAPVVGSGSVDELQEADPTSR